MFFIIKFFFLFLFISRWLFLLFTLVRAEVRVISYYRCISIVYTNMSVSWGGHVFKRKEVQKTHINNAKIELSLCDCFIKQIPPFNNWNQLQNTYTTTKTMTKLVHMYMSLVVDNVSFTNTFKNSILRILDVYIHPWLFKHVFC